MPDAAVPPQPLEVELVGQVKRCETCSWFFRGTRPYGPYPAYDWNEPFPPQAVRIEKQPSGTVPPQPWLNARLVGSRFMDPGILHGCRKAPIMTIGINPNLTAWFARQGSAPWTYPSFAEDARYAYYYRYFTLYQESVAPEFVLANIDNTERVVAARDGYVKSVSREFTHNYFELVIRYDGSEEDCVFEIAWAPDKRWVVLKQPGEPGDPHARFQQGEVLAGQFNVPEKKSADIYSNASDYYQRMVGILDRFKELARLDGRSFLVGEDVAQHDMIACASPGWQAKYEIPMDRIAHNCVSRHGWIVRQIVQSQPVVIILVGLSALAMFRSVFGPYMRLDDSGADLYQILSETCRRPTYLSIDIGEVKFETRLILSPHFSYADGFTPGARLSGSAWKAFATDFGPDAKKLAARGRVIPSPDPTALGSPVLVSRLPGDPLWQELSVSGKRVLEGFCLDPIEMIAQALTDEYKRKTIRLDPASGRLVRSRGPCRFCDNDRWKFPRGCEYGKEEEPALPAGQLECAVTAILARAKEAARAAAPGS